MKENNRSLISIVMILVGVWIINQVVGTSDVKTVVLYFLIFVVVVGVSNFIHIFLHELGHLICGTIAHYDFYSMDVGMIRFEKKDKKLKISIAPRGGARGQCMMLYNDKVTREGHMLYYSGGIIFNAFTLIILSLCLVIFLEKIPFAPFGQMVILYNMLLALLALYRNASKRSFGMYTTDAQMVSEFRNNTLYAREYYKVEDAANKLKIGEAIENIEIDDIINEEDFLGPIDQRILILNMQLSYYNFIRAVVTNDKELAQRMKNFMERHLSALAPTNQIIHLYELVFYYIYFDYNFEKCVEKYNIVEKIITKDTLSCSYRVRAYFEYYMMYNAQTAKEMVVLGKDGIKNYPVLGLAKYEQSLLDALFEAIKKDEADDLLPAQAAQKRFHLDEKEEILTIKNTDEKEQENEPRSSNQNEGN